MVALTRNRTRRNEDGGSRSNNVDEPGKAVTKAEDLKLVEEFRHKYLDKRKDTIGWIGQYLKGVWARIEVHTGAYMFDLREHIIFYALFALVGYLICASLLHVGAYLVGYIL